MLENINNLILDMDGVLWRGSTPIPGLAEFFNTLDELQIGYVLATNNATKTAVQYTKKLASFSVQIPAERILTSAETTAAYLANKYPQGTEIYIIGAAGLHEALANRGFEIISPDDVRKGAMSQLVVQGFKNDVVYEELAMGALLVSKGASFVGTNPDVTIPDELGPLPGAGSLLAVISTATGVEPLIIGKPQPIVFEEAVRRLGSSKENTAMVGDRLSTDIQGGKSAGLWTILLLSGISSVEDVEKSAVKPDYIFKDINELAAQLRNRGKTIDV